MTNSAYAAKVFPFVVGGGPGAKQTLVITVTAGGEGTPVAVVADRAAYFAANSANQAKHDRFSAIVLWMMQYGVVVSAASDGNTVLTLTFEQKDLWAPNTTIGLPAYGTKIQRSDAYALLQSFITAQGTATGVTVLAVTIDGVAQTS